MKSLKMFCVVILQHQALLRAIVFKICICVMDCAKPSTVGPCFLPCHALPTKYSMIR